MSRWGYYHGVCTTDRCYGGFGLTIMDFAPSYPGPSEPWIVSTCACGCSGEGPMFPVRALAALMAFIAEGWAR